MGGSYLSAEMQSVYFSTPADWPKKNYWRRTNDMKWKLKTNVCNYNKRKFIDRKVLWKGIFVIFCRKSVMYGWVYFRDECKSLYKDSLLCAFMPHPFFLVFVFVFCFFFLGGGCCLVINKHIYLLVDHGANFRPCCPTVNTFLFVNGSDWPCSGLLASKSL